MQNKAQLSQTHHAEPGPEQSLLPAKIGPLSTGFVVFLLLAASTLAVLFCLFGSGGVAGSAFPSTPLFARSKEAIRTV
jgi:hypothetical protein